MNRSGWAVLTYLTAVLAAIPKIRISRTGSALWRASSRIQSSRSCEGVAPVGRKRRLMPNWLIGGSSWWTAVTWLTSRCGLVARGQRRALVQPRAGQGGGELVEEQHVVAAGAMQGEGPAGRVEAVQP